MSDATPAKSKPAKKAPSKRGGRRSGSGRKRTKVPAVGLGAEVAALIDALVGGAGGMVLKKLVIELAVDPRAASAAPHDSGRDPDPAAGDSAT